MNARFEIPDSRSLSTGELLNLAAELSAAQTRVIARLGALDGGKQPTELISDTAVDRVAPN